MNNTLTASSERRVARPLKVLIPLIKEDLQHGEAAAKEAGMPYYIKAGEKLLEAKRQVPGLWSDWVQRNFHLSQERARAYMRAAKQHGRGEFHETLSRSSGDQRNSHEPPWTESIKERLRGIRVENFNIEREEENRETERGLVTELAAEIVSIGYKVLAVKMHPDKGGSAAAMRRLNEARDTLREAIR